MTELSRSTLLDLHGALTIYAGYQSLRGISSRATDLLWSDLPEVRPLVDLTFGYGLAALLLWTHAWLRFQPLRAAPAAAAVMCLLAATCASQLLSGALSLPQYAVYEGDSLITLLVSASLLVGLAR